METKEVSILVLAPISDDEFKTETTYERQVSTILGPAEATTHDYMNLVESSGALDFWNDPEEDVYGEERQ